MRLISPPPLPPPSSSPPSPFFYYLKVVKGMDVPLTAVYTASSLSFIAAAAGITCV